MSSAESKTSPAKAIRADSSPGGRLKNSKSVWGSSQMACNHKWKAVETVGLVKLKKKNWKNKECKRVETHQERYD